MNKKPYKEIAQISPEEREIIRRKTAYSLPDEPTARGMRPDQVRKRFWEAIAGDKSSMFAEIDRLAGETNTALDALWMLLYGTVEIDGEQVGIADLIKTGLAQGHTLTDLFEGLASGDALRLIHEKTTGKSLQQCLDDLGKLDLTAKVAPIIGGHRVTLTDKNGDKYFDVMDGEKGKPFSVAKVYNSVKAMHAGYATDGVEIGGFVVIETGNVDDEDNARMYIKGNYAYEYVTDLSGMQGMTGPQGPAGIHIGAEPPTDGQSAWIDTGEEPDEGGGAQIDVVAKPGQVIVVATVDANGKPLTYKAVDLPVHDAPDWNAAEGAAGHVLNRTHYVDEKSVIHKLPNKFIDADWMATSEKYVDNTIVIPEQSVTTIWNNRQMDIQPGIIYDVHINGVVYPCEALNEDGGIILGNNISLTMNNLPFCIFWAGGTATGGFFYKNSSVLSGTIYMKVTGHSYEKYNTLPKEYLPEISWNELTDKPFAEDTGDLLFSHTSTFATDNASEKITGVSLSLTVGAEYWIEINGELLKCRWENVGSMEWELRDSEGNRWLRRAVTAWYLYGKSAGTYTYNLYGLSENIVLDPQYIPSSIARKSDIPTGGGTGGTSIDVTAEVGQTIIVKEVDANGKPTKWESADYQERICNTEVKLIYPEQNCVFNEDLGAFIAQGDTSLTVGNTYIVNYNGVDYTEKCVSVNIPDGVFVGLGNYDAFLGTGDNGVPFFIIDGSVMGMSGIVGVMPIDNATSVALSIKVVVYTPIPQQYLANALPYYIEVTGSGTADDPYVCAETVVNVEAIYRSGRSMVARHTMTQETEHDAGVTRYTDLSHYYLTGVLDSTEVPHGLLFAFLKSVEHPTVSDKQPMLYFLPQEDGTYAVSKSIG